MVNLHLLNEIEDWDTVILLGDIKTFKPQKLEFEDIKDDCKFIFTAIIKEAGHEEDQSGFSDYSEWFGIFNHKGDWGYIHYTPDGYSSYTYEPATIIYIYKSWSFEYFKKLSLTQDMRDLIGDLKPETLEVLYGT